MTGASRFSERSPVAMPTFQPRVRHSESLSLAKARVERVDRLAWVTALVGPQFEDERFARSSRCMYHHILSIAKMLHGLLLPKIRHDNLIQGGKHSRESPKDDTGAPYRKAKDGQINAWPCAWHTCCSVAARFVFERGQFIAFFDYTQGLCLGNGLVMLICSGFLFSESARGS